MLFGEYWLDIRDRVESVMVRFTKSPETYLLQSDRGLYVNKEEFIDLKLCKEFNEFWRNKTSHPTLVPDQIPPDLQLGQNCLNLIYRLEQVLDPVQQIQLEYGDEINLKEDGSIKMKERTNHLCSDVQLWFYAEPPLIRLK